MSQSHLQSFFLISIEKEMFRFFVLPYFDLGLTVPMCNVLHLVILVCGCLSYYLRALALFPGFVPSRCIYKDVFKS